VTRWQTKGCWKELGHCGNFAYCVSGAVTTWPLLDCLYSFIGLPWSTLCIWTCQSATVWMIIVWKELLTGTVSWLWSSECDTMWYCRWLKEHIALILRAMEVIHSCELLVTTHHLHSRHLHCCEKFRCQLQLA